MEVIEVVEREVEVIELIERGPAGPTGPQPDINYTVVSSSRTLEAADLIAADTSGGAFTLTLPLNPSDGDAVDIFDFSDTFDTNNLTIARNGSRIESLEDNLICNVEGAYFTLIYTGSTRGWQVLPRYGTTGGSGGGELTTQGDMLYRGVVVNARLPIGTAGQVLKVNSGATAPEWGTPPDSIDDYTVVTTSQTLLNGSRTAANTTSGPFTLTLPAAPSGGDTVYLLDFSSTFDTNNLTLARNGSNIEGLAENMVCNVEGSSFKMVYTGVSSGWQMIPYYGTGVAIGANATDVLSLSSGQIVADDPAADRLVFWDDSENKLTYLQAGSGLAISGTTITASGGDAVSIAPSAADILTATSGAISADDAGSDKIVYWKDADSKLAYGSVVDVGAASASHTHDAAAITTGILDNARINFAAPDSIGSTTRNSGAFTTLSAAPTSGSALTLTGGTVTASAPLIDATQTWNASGTTFTGLRVNVTNTASASASLLMDLQTGGTSQFSVRRDGLVNAALEYRIAGVGVLARGAGFNLLSASCIVGWGGTGFNIGNTDLTVEREAADIMAQRRTTNAQTFRIYNTFTSATNFERLNIIAQSAGSVIIGTEKGSGGGTARALEFRTDNTTRLTIGSAGGFTLADAQDIAVGTTTGTKIGTATTQKIGFFNATPVVQQAAVADATDAASTQDRLNDLLARLRTLGLIAT